MDFELSSEQREWQEKIRKLANEEIAPGVDEVDKTGQYPWDNVKAMAKEGLFGFLIPKQYGGLQQSYLAGAIAMEEISKVCAGTMTILTANWMGSEGIKQSGSESQKAKYLPLMARGEIQCSFALTEYQAGSDAAGLITQAKLKEGQYVINGSKRYAGNVEAAQIFVVPAKTSPEKRAKGITVFIVERETPGISITRIHNKMGLRGSIHGDLLINDCVVPKENILGEVDDGFRIVLKILDKTRIFSGAAAVGIAEAAYRAALTHSKTRIQFGRPLAENQAIQFMLADMDVEIQAARLLVYQATISMDKRQGDVSKAAAVCKLYASEVVKRVTDGAMQIYAGFGYDLDSPVNRYYRDGRSFPIMEGASEILKIIISRRILA